MKFIDAHMHLIDTACLPYPWLSPPFDRHGPNGDTSAIARSYDLVSYLKDMRDWLVRGVVHVEAGVGLDDGGVELDHVSRVLSAAISPDETGNCLLEGAAIVVYAPLDAPDLAARLDRYACFPLLRGIRHIVNAHPLRARAYPGPDRTRSEAWRAGLATLARFGLSFDLQCFPSQMHGLAPVFRRLETLPVVIDHLGMPLLDVPDGRDEWEAAMTAMAACPNVHIKLSGFGFVARRWGYDDVRPFMARLVELFGVERCLFASDFPTDLLFAPAADTLECIDRFSRQFSVHERTALLGGNASRFYRLGLAI